RAISGHSSCTITVEDDIDNPQEVKTVTISLGDTYYGGTLNVTTGVLTITHGIKIFDGTLSYTMTSDGKIVYCDATPDAKVIESNYGQESAICDHFRNEPNSASIRQGTVDMSFNIGSAYFSMSPRTVFRNSNWASVSDAINFFTNNPTQIVYQLVTPTTVQLTPTEVRTLLEDNNIFADTGDVVSCKYLVEVT
ncbi:MAG: hypothetical protein IIY21_27265, partial [Clostridiales bacterium]|nr:hypothetical protein [Clostridiales bacterium]